MTVTPGTSSGTTTRGGSSSLTEEQMNDPQAYPWTLTISGSGTLSEQEDILSSLKGVLTNNPFTHQDTANFFGTVRRGDPRTLLEPPPDQAPSDTPPGSAEATGASGTPLGVTGDTATAAPLPASGTTAQPDAYSLVAEALATPEDQRTQAQRDLLDAARAALDADATFGKD